MKKIAKGDTGNLVKGAYILPEDYDAITHCTEHNNFGVSFRLNKPEALNMLSLGAGTKPHDIPDKSFSRKIFMDNGLEFPRQLNNFLGLVPKWKMNIKEDFPILGLFLTTRGMHHSAISSFGTGIEEVSDKVRYLKLDSYEKMNELWQVLTQCPNWQQYFITGDYDMHDLVSYTSQRGPIPSESPDETRAINALNQALGETDFQYRKIQHGPQYNYIAHMKSQEPGKPISIKVADIDLPVAFCARGQWTILETRKDLEDFYSGESIHLKWTWMDSEEAQAYMKRVTE